ncbi:unnamed protein product [Citrullus colocynthis]|uniref:Uncharacterized protein n=1 Tax=Citrullus colocynthis TaxID=252529 RepID=A0ABP0ZC97_9ROSI
MALMITKGKENRSKALVLKWGNHKHRILINKDVDPGLPKHKECPAMVAASSAALPWNLRTRSKTLEVGMEEEEKKISKAVENGRKINVVDEKRNLRSTTEKKEPVMKLAVPLSTSDIEEDFRKMIGKKPPSRPKKRSRLAQQDVINTTYLGLSLVEIHSDRYDVPRPPPCTKKVKGKIGQNSGDSS